MGEDKTANKKRKRIMTKAQVKVIISREYVGTQTVAEAFIPIISEDIRREIAKDDTFDKGDIRPCISGKRNLQNPQAP